MMQLRCDVEKLNVPAYNTKRTGSRSSTVFAGFESLPPYGAHNLIKEREYEWLH